MNKHFAKCLGIGLSLVLVAAPLLHTTSGNERTLSSTRPAGRKPAPPHPKTRPLSVPKTKAPLARAKQDMPKVSGQSTTLLADGRWLLVGGDGDSMSQASVFDSETGEIIPILNGPLNPRKGHSATMLPNGTVLILGGIRAAGQYVDAAEIFNPETETFEKFAVTSLTPRAHHTATLLTDGRVLIAGGTDGKGKLSRSIELFDPQKKISSVIPARLPSGRNNHIAVLQADGTVVLSGGTDTNGNNRSDGEIYNPETQTFISTASPSNKENKLTTRLEFSSPASGAMDVDENVVITLRFSRPLSVKTLNRQNAVLEGPRGEVAVRVVPAEAGMLAFITPLAPLATASNYNLTINGATDRDGRALPFVAVSFKTKECSSCENTSETSSQILDMDSWIPNAKNLNGDWRSGQPDSSARSLPALQAPTGQTALSGQVLTLSGNPLANVTLQIEGETARTDHTGRFLLSNLKAGRPVLTIQGHTVSRPGKTYGTFDVLVDVAAGKTTVLPYTIWLPVLDDHNAVRLPIPTAREIAVTTPRVPGMEVRIPSNAVLRLPNGKHHMHGLMKRELTSMAITPIPVDRSPFPLPPGVDDGLLFTLQLHGAKVEGLQGEKRPGLRIVFPNYQQLPAGTRVGFWNYDAENGAGWYMYGYGTVTPDRRQVVPDPGVELQSMHCISLMNKMDTPGEGPAPGDCTSGADPVDLGTGLFVYQKTDLSLPDLLPISLMRTYRPKDSIVRSFGKGSTNPYDIYIAGDTYNYGQIVLPDGGLIRFDKIPNSNPWVYEHTATPTRFYKATMRQISGIGPNGAYEVRLTDGSIYQFGIKVLWGDIFGPHSTITGLSAIQDRFGNRLTILRDSSFRMSKIISPNGRWIEFSYSDTSKRIAQARDNIGRVVSYTYDASERLWKVTDPNGGVTEYLYDSSDRMLSVKDPRGIVYVTNQYDANGRVIRQTQADGGVYQIAYTVNGAGKVVQTDLTDPRGFIRRVTFSSSGYRLTDTFALGRPEQQISSYERQAGPNFILNSIDPLNRKTAGTYDAKGNLTSITRLADTPEAVTTNITYEPMYNQIATMTDPLGHTVTYGYNPKGLLTSVTDALGHKTTLKYNAASELTSETDALGNTTNFIYDRGVLVEIIDALGRVKRREKDAAGRLISETNPLGAITRYEYNSLNQRTKLIDPLQGVTEFSYDPNGNLLNVTDARNSVTSYTYSNMDRVAVRRDPLMRDEPFQYDLNGNIQQVTDRKGQVTGFTYDALNRLTQVTYADSSTTTYTYDAGNRLTQVVDSLSGTISYSYDGHDRLTNETTPLGSVTHTYDAGGRLTSTTVAGQPTATYSYDDANRRTQISQGGSTVSFAYNALGRRTSLTMPNGVVTEYGYDVVSQLTSLVYKRGTTVLGNLTYQYDASGRRTFMGGSFARSITPQTVVSASYNAANHQLTLGDQTLTYDLNGNLLSDGTHSYTWDARNRLVSVSGSQVSGSFQYDAVGRRISRAINGTTINFLYNGNNIVQEQSSGSGNTNILGGGIDEIFARTDSSGVYSPLADALGSWLATTDATGTLQTDYTYSAFGQTATFGAANANSSQYAGRENDEATRLYYYRARYYSPTLHRFISEDPIGFASGDTNFYSYVGNNPVNKIDPFGLDDADREWAERGKPPAPDPWYWSHNESADNPPDTSPRKPCEGEETGPMSTPELMVMGAIALPARRPSPGALILGACIAVGVIATCAATDICGNKGGGKVIPFPGPRDKPKPLFPPLPWKPGEICPLVDQTGKICTYQCKDGYRFTIMIPDKFGKCPSHSGRTNVP